MRDDRKRQVKTTKERKGADFYKKIGAKGGEKSTTKFSSTAGSEAAKKRWADWRKKKEQEKQKGKNGKHIQDIQPTGE